MLLYHGSNIEILKPDLAMSKKYLDFGIGFYLTSNKEQAIMFSRKVVLREMRKRKPPGEAIVSIYEFDSERAKNELSILEFNEPSNQWLDYIINNRIEIDETSMYDIVIGPVANDDVYKVIDRYESGILTREMAMAALKIRKLYNQHTFKTEKAIRYLGFVSSQNVREGNENAN